MSRAQLRAAFDRVIGISPFARWMGVTLEDVSIGRVVIRVQLRDEHRQHHGVAHGAVVAFMADSACAWAAGTHGSDVVTAEFKLQLMDPAQGAALEATGEVLRTGRRLIVARADVHALQDNGSRELVATSLATIAVLPAREGTP